MRTSAVSLASSAAIALVIALPAGPASAKTAAECDREYTANKAAIKASGQSKKDYVAACHAAATAPAAPASSPEPAVTHHSGY